MDQGEAIKGSKDHVHFPVDVPEKRWDSKSESAVPAPVGGSGKGDCLGANLCGEDFRGVSPGGGTLVKNVSVILYSGAHIGLTQVVAKVATKR